MAEKNELEEPRIKIFLDGSWTEFMPYAEARKYEFSQCIIEERLTKTEYYKRYFDVPKR